MCNSADREQRRNPSDRFWPSRPPATPSPVDFAWQLATPIDRPRTAGVALNMSPVNDIGDLMSAAAPGLAPRPMEREMLR
jgi:hypothetical protein